MYSIQSVKRFVAVLATPFLLTTNSQAVLVIAGVSDGDLSGGNPKAVIFQAGAAVADLSQWGFGSANNGLGSDGEEYTFAAGSAALGDVFVIAGNTDSFNFFANNFVQNFTLIQSGAANINGDDAIELFNNGLVFDTYGDPDTDGNGETWEYEDGFARRTGGGPGAFDQANYTTGLNTFDGMTEQQHIDVFVAAGFTQIVPEPSSVVLLGLGAVAFLRRRR